MRVGLALLLGALGFWLNHFNVSLLAEGPEFIFGGAAALIAFVWLGPGPGLLATIVSLATFGFTRGTAAVVTVVYLLEVSAVWWLYRRIGSLVAASAVYWLTAGWMVDRLMYGGVLGLQFPFLMLLLLKQLLNGFINATVAEATFWLMPARLSAAIRRPAQPERLQMYVFRRVMFVVLLPLFGLTFLYTGVSYERRVDEARAQQLRTASDLRLQVEALTLRQNEALMWLGRMAEIKRVTADADLQALLPMFERWHPQFTAVGLTDREGRIVAALPERRPGGEALVGGSVARQRFFGQAREAMRMSSVPQVMGADAPDGGPRGPSLIMAPPLIDKRGEFDGVVFGAVHPDQVRAVLSRVPGSAGHVPTLLTSDFRVIGSLDPKLGAGMSLRSRLPVGRLSGAQTALFSYFPPPDGSWNSRLGMDQRYAAYQAIPAFDLAVLVDLPIASLQQQMLPTTFSAIAVLIATLALAYLVAGLVSRHIARPLTRVNAISSDIAAGHFPGPAPLVELAGSGIEEVRGVGANLLTMQDGLMEYRRLSTAREQESEERFSATFHQAAVGIAHLDPRLCFQRVNERLCAIVGATPADLLGQSLLTITHPDDREASDALFRALLDGQPQGRLEARYRRRDGHEAATQLTVSLVRDQQGAAKYFILVMEDVADRKRLEVELLQAQKMESVGRLAGGVAHDFNNLLTAILGYGEILASRLAGDARALADLAQIQEAGERASRLTRQLLAFARRQVIEPRAVDLNDLVRNMESMLRRLIGEHIELESRLDPGVDCVRADPGQIEQVVLNLVVNARDAMPEGGRITLSTGIAGADAVQAQRVELPPGRYVALTVTDTGEGMSEEVIEHIFEPFFTTKSKERGTGLGLATCYGIIKQSGGDIGVTSQPGRGSAFCVYLPAMPRESAVPAAERRPVTAQGGRESVLLVEDEPSVARMAQHALEAQGYTVLLAADGVAALERLARERHQPHLLVTDVVMPHMGGAELAARLRQTHPGLRVLFTSGYSYEAIGDQGELKPGTAFLQKPFTPAALARAVRQVLDDEEMLA